MTWVSLTSIFAGVDELPPLSCKRSEQHRITNIVGVLRLRAFRRSAQDDRRSILGIEDDLSVCTARLKAMPFQSNV